MDFSRYAPKSTRSKNATKNDKDDREVDGRLGGKILDRAWD